MNIQQDFKELLQFLEEFDVEYLIIGGYAVAFHGYPRFTKDIDIFYKRSETNILKIQKALVKFGFKPEELPPDIFQSGENIITLGVDPVRVDFISEIEGVKFNDAWKNRIRGTYSDTEVNFIGKTDLIINKSSTRRLQDKADAEKLS